MICFNKKLKNNLIRLPLPWPVVSSSPNVTCRRSLLLLFSSAADPSCNSTKPNSSNTTLQSMIANLTSSKCRLFYLIFLLVSVLLCLELMSPGGDVLLYYMHACHPPYHPPPFPTYIGGWVKPRKPVVCLCPGKSDSSGRFPLYTQR
jgi:hypothetical protein